MYEIFQKEEVHERPRSQESFWIDMTSSLQVRSRTPIFEFE